MHFLPVFLTDFNFKKLNGSQLDDMQLSMRKRNTSYKNDTENSNANLSTNSCSTMSESVISQIDVRVGTDNVNIVIQHFESFTISNVYSNFIVFKFFYS